MFKVIRQFRSSYWIFVASVFVFTGLVGWFPFFAGVQPSWGWCLFAHGIGFSISTVGKTISEAQYLARKSVIDAIKARGPKRVIVYDPRTGEVLQERLLTPPQIH